MYSLPGAEAENAGASLQSTERSSERQLDYTERKRIKNKAARVIFEQLRGEESEGFWLDSNWRLERELGLGVDQATVDKINRFIDYNNLTDIVKADDVINYIDAKAKVRDANAEAGRIASDAQAEAAAQDRNIEQAQMDFGAEPASATPGYTMRKRKSKGPVAGEEQPGIGPESGLTTKSEVTPVAQTETASVNSPSQQASPRFQELQYEYDKLFPAGSGVMPLSEMVDFARDVIDKRSNEARQKGLKDNRSTRYQAIRGELLTKSIVQTTRQAEKISTALLDLFDDERLYPLADKILDASSKLPEDIRKNFDSIFTYHLGLRGTTNDLGTAQNPAPIRIGADIIWDYLVQTDPRAREFRDSSVQKYGERSSVEEVIDYVKNVLYPRPESAPMQYAAGVAIGPDTVHDPYDLKVFASPEDAGRSNANPIAKIWITPKSDGSNDINIKADYDLRKILTAAAGISIFSRGRWVTSEKYTYKSGRWVEKPTSAAGEGPEPSPSTKPGGPVGTQLSASLGFIPAVITADLDDDEEYFPGVTGRTLKQAALVFGAFATVRLGSKSGMFKLGSKVVPQSSPRAAMLNAADSLPPADVGSFGRLREKFPKFKDRVAAIRQHVDETARLLKLSKDEADAMFQQNLADERTLDGLPLVPGVTMLTTLGNLGRESSHPYPKQLNEAAYRGKASGQVLAIHAREARNVYESLDDPTKVKLGELIADIDYDTTKIINGDRDLDQGMRRVKGWQPQQNTTMDLRYYRSRVEDALGKTDAALLKAYRTIVEPLNKARAAYFDALAYEQTGEYIGPGMQKYSKMVMDSDKLMMDMQKGIQKMVQDGATQQEIDRAITALRGAQANYSTALRMRGILNELQLAQQQSVERQYIKRWLETPDAKMTVRIKQTATDPGTLQYFTESGQYADFMAEMNKPRSLSELGLTSRTHPVTGEVINSMKDLYIANGGTIDTRYGKASMQDLAKASVDPMIIRQALQNFIDAKSNGTIPGKQFAEFINLFGNDIRLLVDAKTLQDLNITNALGDKSKSAAGVSTNTIRQLINAIAVPRYVDPTKPRLNVLGYFPGKVDVVTKQANPNYDKQVINFMNGVIDHFEGTVLSKAEEGEIRRVANLQIADLVSRNVAPKYVSTVSQIVSGLSWKPRNDWADMKILGSVPDPVLRTLKTIDRGLALAGTFKMLGFNPTSAERNILQCYTNLASQLAAEGMSVTKTIGKAEAAYLRGMADKSSRASAVYEYLKTPASLRSIDDSLTDAMNGNAALAEVFRMAQASGAFEATFYRSLENEIGGFMAPGTKTRKVYEAAQLPQKVAEHHNRGISFIAGAMQALEARPNDIMGAYANGLRMQNMTQGNFASYNKTTLERMIADMPIGTSIMLLKSAAMRSTEQLLSHILVAATRVRGMETTVTPLAYGKRTLTTYKTNAKVFAPILATLATNLIFTGLAGSVVTGDAIVALEHLYNAFNKDDDELAAVNENFTDFYKSKGRAFADKMGIPTETYNFIWDSAHSGMMSAITGRNFGTDNDVTSLLFGDVPGFSIINDFSKVGGGDRDPATIARSINTQLGRVVKSVTQLAEGGKLGKGGYVVDKDYSAADALKDVALPSNLREAMYGVSKREDGGTIFFPDEAENYLSKLDRIDGLKLGGIHKDPFFAKVPGREKPQAQPNAVNRLRALIIGNYYDYSDAMETTLNKWEEIKDRPGVKQKLVDIAMKGQQGSRLSAAPDQFFKDAERRIRSYYLARAVQDSYLQLGLPAPAYKYANKDPMMPLVKFIAGKLRGGYKNIPDVQWEQSPYENYQGYQTPEYEAEQP
jgi:hypothetical protein